MSRILTIATVAVMACTTESVPTKSTEAPTADSPDGLETEGQNVAPEGESMDSTAENQDSAATSATSTFACKPAVGTPLPPVTATTEANTQEADIPTGEPGAPPQLDAPANVAGPGPNAAVTASGLAYEVLRTGYGSKKPSREDRVEVHYSGWTTDGQRFDSSVSRGKPSEFPLTSVIAGWTEGLQLMVPGELTRFWIPEELAYQGRPGKPAGMLVFDVQLLSIKSNTAPFPKDGHTLPEEYIAAGEGVAYTYLRQGRGDANIAIGPRDTVQIRHQGWSADEQFVGGTANRGKPADFAVQDLPSAWCHPIVSMKKGDKVRVWASPEASETAQHMVYELELVGVAKQVTPPDSLQVPPPEATVHQSGMAYMILNDAPPSEDKPRSRARVSAHLTVWDTNGQTLQTTQSTGKPQTIALKAMPPGVSAGIQMMDAGDKYRMWVPQELTAESPARRADTGLVFDIELLEIVVNPPPPPSAPDNANQPPDNAITIAEGVEFLSIPKEEAASSDEGPTPSADEMVTFEIIEWTQAGVYLAGTDESGSPVTRPMRSLSPALQAAFTRMQAGQTARVWSTKEQAATRGRPAQHDVVMDVTLTNIGAPARPPRRPMTAPPK